MAARGADPRLLLRGRKGLRESAILKGLGDSRSLDNQPFPVFHEEAIMRNRHDHGWRSAVVLAVTMATAVAAAQTDLLGKEPMLAHNVFFSLNDDSDSAKQALVAGCRKYLSQHPGTAFFAAGVLADEMKREVNDRDFDVALHVVFETAAAQDKYQQADEHQKFIEEFKDNWEKVRVFDSLVER
jgi:hypothetical protein